LLYAEDFPVGREFALGSRAVTADEIKAFAREWDPLPFHVDDEAAARGPFGGLVACGAHSLAMFSRLMSDAVISRSAVIAGRGARDLSLLRPVRAGAVLTGAVTVLECDLVSEDAGNVIMRGTLSDEAQETMVVIHIDALIRRRGA